MPAPLPLKSIVISGERTMGSFAEFAQSDNLDGRLTKLRHGQRAQQKNGHRWPGKKMSPRKFEQGLVRGAGFEPARHFWH
jgi:hypothetical protein